MLQDVQTKGRHEEGCRSTKQSDTESKDSLCKENPKMDGRNHQKNSVINKFYYRGHQRHEGVRKISPP